MKYAIIAPSALADHAIIILNLADINVIDLFAAVLLTNPVRRAVVLDGLLEARAHLTNRQRRFILTASYDMTLPARPLRELRLGGSLLREPRRGQREGK